eukprot:COSAG06_NODE_580_length_14025_cov_11.644478_5_plen_828_part_00
MHLIRRDWDRISMKTVERVLVKLEEDIEEIRSSRWARFKAKLPWTNLYKMRDEADFKIVQLIFKTQFHLQHNFDYVMYAKSVLEDLVVDLANISVYHWIGICLFCVGTNVGQELTREHGAAEWSTDNLLISEEEEELYEANSGGRRRLGGASGPTDPWVGCSGVACGLGEEELVQRIAELSATNYSNYTWTCGACRAKALAGTPDATESQLAFAMFVYLCIGLTLLIVHSLINADLTLRMNKVLKYAGAHDPFKVKDLLTKLQADLTAYQLEEAQASLEAAMNNGQSGKPIEIFEEEEDDGVERVAGEDGSQQQAKDSPDQDPEHVIEFEPLEEVRNEQDGENTIGGERKTSRDVMTLDMFGYIMWMTKFVCLMNCFYLGFYVVHMSYKVSRVTWNFLPGDVPILANFIIHMLLIAPTIPMVCFMLPITIRRMALLWGVLYLSDEAVNDVYSHMEQISSVRNRIIRRLRGSKFLKGKPKPDEGERLLTLVKNGEIVMLSQLVERDAMDRLTASQVWEKVNAFKTHTTDKELTEFLDREAFAEYLKDSPADQATSQTAKTLVIDASDSSGNTDTITVGECTRFILRAVADVLNVASEHGTNDAKVQLVRDAITALPHISDEDYEVALFVARVKSLFHSVDADRSGSITRRELWKAMRKFKVPVQSDEVEVILRVMDPDQSGAVSMQEWLDFMLASEDDLEAITVNTEHTINSLNAQKSLMDESMKSVSNMAAGGMGAVASGLDSTLGAVPLVGGLTDSVVSKATQSLRAYGRSSEPACRARRAHPSCTVRTPQTELNAWLLLLYCYAAILLLVAAAGCCCRGSPAATL